MRLPSLWPRQAPRRAWLVALHGAALWCLVAVVGPARAAPEARLLTAEEEAATDESAPEDEPAADESTVGDEASLDDATLPDDAISTLVVEDVPPDVMSPPEPRSRAVAEPSDERSTDEADAPESPANEGDPAADDGTLVTRAGLVVEAAKFKGLQPGVSGRDDAEAALGAAGSSETVDGQEVRTYQVPPFRAVSVWIADERVTSIVVDLERPFAEKLLAEQLALGGIQPVEVISGEGQVVGAAFPERAVMFSYAPAAGERQVTQLILDEIDGEPFVVRAESLRRHRLEAGLDDLVLAEKLTGPSPRIAGLRAELLLDAGRAVDALASAEQAVEGAPDEPRHRLALAQALMANAEYTAAAGHLSRVVQTAAEDPAVLAQAHWHWGHLAASGPERDYQSAVTHHLEAIKLAEPLAQDQHPQQRRAGLETLFKAHLALANDIAWGRWKSQATVVPQWLDRAGALAETLTRDHPESDAALQLARAKLAADVGQEGRLGALPALDEARQAAAALLELTSDPLRQEQLHWELGLALYDAMQAEIFRERFPQALDLGREALEELTPVAEARPKFPGQDYLLGRLVFRIGSLHAIQMQDHESAIEWFEQAVPLLEEPIPLSALADLGRQGETFVSIGVSYWETGRHDEAVRLTAQGASLMEQAVREGSLDPGALAVPYGNLSSMHRHLGHDEEAESYESLAAKSESPPSR